MRVGIVALLHESNTFAAPTPLARFDEDLLVTGAAVRQRLAGTHHEVGGFFEQLDADGIEAVPVFAARAMPSGTLQRDTADALLSRLLEAVKDAGQLDGWLVAPHGAAVAEGQPDFDGTWLLALRQLIGGVAVLGTLDLHANVSAAMIAATDGLIAYRSNPHLDQRDRGREAAALMARTLRREIVPTTAAEFPPVVINIEAQATADSPCRDWIALADDVRGRPGVLSASLVLGFPYSDVAEMGASVIVTTDNNPTLARTYARELSQWLIAHREDFRGRLTSVADAVTLAGRDPGPVGLLDMGDNVGGGSPANSTVLLHEIRRQNIGPAFACLFDPDAVQRATAAGIGETVSLLVGDPPLAGDFTVAGLYDGVFEETQPRHGGQRRFDQGPTARLVGDGLTLLATSLRVAPFSLRQLTACNIEPARFRVLVVKGVHAPVAAYAPVCSRLVRVNTPGLTSADLSAFPYHHRRRPLFPFEPEVS